MSVRDGVCVRDGVSVRAADHHGLHLLALLPGGPDPPGGGLRHPDRLQVSDSPATVIVKGVRGVVVVSVWKSVCLCNRL